MVNVELMRIGKEERACVSSRDVAETFGKRHADVLRAIGNLDCSHDFTERNFALSEYADHSGKMNREYIMTRDGFVFLAMGFTGEKAAQFKEAYITQFNAMEKALHGKLIEREKGIAVRQALTKAIQQSNENDRMHGFAYPTYTSCIYKTLFGMNANQLRENRGIGPKENLRDYLSTEELSQIESMERLVSGLVDCGWEYDSVKKFISTANTKRLSA